MNNEDTKTPDPFRRRRTVRRAPSFNDRSYSEQLLNNRAIQKQKTLDKKQQLKDFLTKAQENSLLSKEYKGASLLSTHALREIARYSASRMPFKCHFLAKKYEDIIGHFSFYEPQDVERKFQKHCNHLYQLCIDSDVDPATVRDPGVHTIYETKINDIGEEETTGTQLPAPQPIVDFFTELKQSQSPVDFIDNDRKEVRRPIPSEATRWQWFFDFMDLGHLTNNLDINNIRSNEYVTSKTLAKFFSHYNVSTNTLKQVLNIYNPEQYSGPGHWSMKTDRLMQELLKDDNETALNAAFDITKLHEECSYQSSLILHEIRHPYFHIPLEKAEHIHYKLLKDPEKYFIHRQRISDQELDTLQQEYDSRFYRD